MTIERTAIEARVLASLEAGRIPVLLGGCGTGRTTLLRRLADARSAASRYIDLAAVATTPERCLLAVSGTPAPRGMTAQAAFERLMDQFDRVDPAHGGRTFLFDEFQELRTFENFPGLRHVQRDFIARLAASSNAFVLASRFTARAHRLLREAPARFEVIHLAPLDVADVAALARAKDGRADWARAVAPSVQAISAGRVAYATALLDAMAGAATSEAETALAELFSPEGRLTALCRFSYEFRLHRARGYGALKAILGILADEEPLTLTDIAQRLHRTPGSTKDYLSWLEDVDVLTVQRKKYAFDDPLVRLYVRLYAGAEPPTRDTVLLETRGYAADRLAQAQSAPAPAGEASAPAAAQSAPAEPEAELVGSEPPSRDSGIIEID
jgi:hypothetical protein